MLAREGELTVQHAAGGVVAVEAGVDSVEHGMGLDMELLPRMAEHGIALTPTLSVITAALAQITADPERARKSWHVPGARAHARLAAPAVEAGATVLAGTDTRPHGGIAQEIRALVAAGVSPRDGGQRGLSRSSPSSVPIPDLRSGRRVYKLIAQAVKLRSAPVRIEVPGRNPRRWMSSGRAIRSVTPAGVGSAAGPAAQGMKTVPNGCRSSRPSGRRTGPNGPSARYHVSGRSKNNNASTTISSGPRRIPTPRWATTSTRLALRTVSTVWAPAARTSVTSGGAAKALARMRIVAGRRAWCALKAGDKKPEHE